MTLRLSILFLIVSGIFFAFSSVYYTNQVSIVNTDFTKNYWLHPNNPALSGAYIEKNISGVILDSVYVEDSIRITISNAFEQRDFLIPESLKDKYLEGIKVTGRISILQAEYTGGSTEILDINFETSED